MSTQRFDQGGVSSSPAERTVKDSPGLSALAERAERSGLFDPRPTRIPAASASSPTSRAASRTRSSRKRSTSCEISSIAARSAPTRAPATAPASWCRRRTSSSVARPASSASPCPSPATMRSARVHAARSGMAEGDPRHLCREGPQEGLSCSAGAMCRTTIPRSASRSSRPSRSTCSCSSGAVRDRHGGRFRAQALRPAQGDLT